MRVLAVDELPFERLETSGDLKLRAQLSPHVSASGHLRLLFREFHTLNSFGALTDRTRIDPLRVESDALFVEFTDMGWDGLDMRLGRQQLIWGSADRFNPTSNLNALDVEDPLLFGKVIANDMLVMRYQPEWSLGDADEPWLDEWGMELAWVPFFRPAQLPASAGLAFTDPAEQARRANTPLLQKLVSQQDFMMGLQSPWTFETTPTIRLPDRTLGNAMLGARMTFTLWEVDLGFSYFNGFDDFPRGEKFVSEVDSAARLADSTLTLTYPRVQVAGFEWATSLGWLDGAGFWGEAALTFHDDLYRVVHTGSIKINEVEREHEAGSFLKATLGMDYSLTSWLYLNVQYLRGFLDEFGTKNLQNYLVAGVDVKMNRDVFLLRIFSIINLDDQSFVFFPSLTFRGWDGGELSMGALVYSSSFPGADPTRKFDSPAAGASTAFFKAKAKF